VRFKASLAALIAVAALAACGGGAGSSLSPATSAGPSSSTSQSATSSKSIDGQGIAAADQAGSPIKDAVDLERDNSFVSSGTQANAAQRHSMSLTEGQCSNGILFTYPAPANGVKATPDPDSTQVQYFYDPKCTQLARTIIRQYNNPSGSGAETVYRTMKQYYQGSTSPVAIVTDTVQLTNGNYDQYGFPIASDGYVRTATGELDMAATKVFAIDTEQVIETTDGSVGSGGSTELYCGDTAGYNATGDATTGMTYGWSGGALEGGTRTVNSDGSVTYQATHNNTPTIGQIGSLSFDYGTPSTSCPIAEQPLFTVTGGTTWGTATFPTTMTLANGLVTSLSITNGQLANGNELNVTSSGDPTSSNFITGTITSAKGTTQLGTFTLDAFGDGTLSMSDGDSFTILDWHVK
jgi:hypothetical protein